MARRTRMTFLASLSKDTRSSVGDPEANNFRINYHQKKNELASYLYELYNREVFGNKLPDNIQITWNSRLTNTAGFFRWVSRCNPKYKICVVRSARIELSPSIVNHAERLRDVLIHEMCHEAVLLIDRTKFKCKKHGPHGPGWIAWTQRAMSRFPELPTITKRHNYPITKKYTYRCVDCGYNFSRTRTSINPARKACGHCLGMFQILVNKKNSVTFEYETPTTVQPLNKFALYTKANYRRIKEENPVKTRGEIMKIVSQQYAEYQSRNTTQKKAKR